MGAFCTPSYEALPTASKTVSGTDIPEWMSQAGQDIFKELAIMSSFLWLSLLPLPKNSLGRIFFIETKTDPVTFTPGKAFDSATASSATDL